MRMCSTGTNALFDEGLSVFHKLWEMRSAVEFHGHLAASDAQWFQDDESGGPATKNCLRSMIGTTQGLRSNGVCSNMTQRTESRSYEPRSVQCANVF